MRQLVRDGWLDPVAGAVPLRDVRDLEDMHMPEVWRRRAANGHSMTPRIEPTTCEDLSNETIQRFLGVSRQMAWRIRKSGAQLIADD